MVWRGEVRLGGHRKNKLYGRLDCRVANQYLRRGTYQKNRVLFENEGEAIRAGYRPCGACLPNHYKVWKEGQAAGGTYTVAVATKLMMSQLNGRANK
jgi:methylphosphotriester-DNA--protein-cysteine methyltransferase